jgi:dTDP-4-dehydrorhamnose reductase
LLGEERIKRVAPLSWITIRTSWLFGGHGNCFPKVIVDRASSGHVLKVVNDQVGCPTYAADLAKAVFELLDRGAEGIWHVTNCGATSWFEFAKSIVEEFGISTELLPISTAQWIAMRPKQATRPSYSVLDPEPYAKLTGRRMRDWRDALRDYRTEVQKGS